MADTISIMSSPTQGWYLDPATGEWHVSYTMPNSSKQIFFAATGEQMDSIFGEGVRPSLYAHRTFEELSKDMTFTGDVTEVAKEGSFESEVRRTISLALDEGTLPKWAQDDPAVMDLVYIAHTEGKSNEWLTEQIAKLESFKLRYPGLDELKKLGMNTTEAVGAFLEMERGIKNTMLRYGFNPSDIDPGIVGELITKGHSLTDVANVYESFERYNENAAAFNAFNEVLAERGMTPLSADDALEFLEGTAPTELYAIWEEASFNEAAQAAGLDMSVSDAVRLASLTEGRTTLADAYSSLNQAASNILRYRGDLALDRYDLDQEDMIDLSLGIAPRSGRSAAEISRNMERALQAARAGIDGPRANRFKQFNQEGVPQAVSTSRSRTQE